MWQQNVESIARAIIVSIPMLAGSSVTPTTRHLSSCFIALLVLPGRPVLPTVSKAMHAVKHDQTKLIVVSVMPFPKACISLLFTFVAM